MECSNVPDETHDHQNLEESVGGDVCLLVNSTQRVRKFRARNKHEATYNLILVSTLPEETQDRHNSPAEALPHIQLQAEFQRLSFNRLETIGNLLFNFITARKGLPLFSFNCQSLRVHKNDLSVDKIAASSNFLILSETWKSNECSTDIPNFDIVVHFKRPTARAGGVAIYHDANDSARIVTPLIDINAKQLLSVSVHLESIGEICACETTLDNGKNVIIVAIYISPNVAMDLIIDFIHESLLKYTVKGSRLLNKDYDKIPMIFSGDFNVNFASDTSLPLINFLGEKFNLLISNDPSEPTTRSQTAIDTVFQRYIANIETKAFVAYFSYHKPLVSFVETTEIMEQ